MTVEYTASSEWHRLNSLRTGLIDRAERLSEITLPQVCPDDTYDTGLDALTNGVTSLGAQLVTNLDNKLMMAMFPASRPFFRLAMSEADTQDLIDKTGLTLDLLTDSLAQGERDALLQLEMSGGREGLYEAMNHLIVVGNILMDTRDKDTLVFHHLKEYVVQRDSKGVPLDIILKQEVCVRELSGDAVSYLPGHYFDDPHQKVCRYTWLCRQGDRYILSEWLDDVRLPDKFGGRYKIGEEPLHALTWRLPLKQHYGVGRVEEYFCDLGAYEGTSEALADGAILASQFRWALNPTGMTRPEDFQNAENGSVIPGNANDLGLIFANIGQQLGTVLTISQVYERRLGAGFLMNSAVTRDAERVTAEEIKLQAQELESTLGGVYSRVARDIQIPIANWLLKKANLSIKGTKIRPVVITGLDALSRNADLERLLQFLSNITSLSQIPPQVRLRLQESNVITDIAAGLGINTKRYVASDDEVQQRLAQLQQQTAQGGDPQTDNVSTEQPQ